MTAADTQILLNKLQSNINQLELTNKGALNALEFRLDAILQANLDTFWLLICAILVFFNAGRLYVFRDWFVSEQEQY